MIKTSHRMGDEMAALPRLAESKMLRMEFGTVAGVRAVPFGVAILHHLYHAKEEAAM